MNRKNAVVINKGTRNIGDDIQTLAALKLLNDPDVLLLEREHLHANDHNGDIKLLCNGWFMDRPENWPPAENIDPYFISFHVAKYKRVRRLMLDQNLKGYYTNHEPIGCRDYETLRLFESMGVPAYFSGCATLTLPKRDFKRSDDIIITDLFINEILTGDYARSVSYKLIPEVYHKNVKLKTHVRTEPAVSIDQQLQEAEALLDEYARAKMVITSRIHCALPCLALGTPVYFFDFGYVRKINRDRFGGILDLMHTVRPVIPFHENRRIDKVVKVLGLHKLFYSSIKPLAIDWETPKPNPGHYQQIADQIREKVSREFSLL